MADRAPAIASAGRGRNAADPPDAEENVDQPEVVTDEPAPPY